MVFLDPKSDVAFKKLFSNPNHKEILINFLNNTLAHPEGQLIVDVQINDPHNHPETIASKASIVDVRCTDQNNNQYIIEMQVMDQQDYAARAQYYVAIAIARQLQKGKAFITLTPVIFVGIINFTIFKGHDYISHHKIMNTETGEHAFHLQEYHFIELPKFHKGLEQLTNDFDKWVYFFKHARELQAIPSQLQQPYEIQEAFTVLEQGNWTLQELEAYERYVDIIRREEGYRETARIKGHQEGKQEGHQKGHQQGKQEGHQEGLQQGLQQGEKKKAEDIAKKLLKTHDSASIAHITGLTPEEIEKLKHS